ncbi:MAG: amidase [Sulfitobacter sp.]
MELLDQSALSLSSALEQGKISAVELMQLTLARIGQVNGDLNAIVLLRDADALMAEAQAADTAERKGWLHGIPIAIKDIANAKGLKTTMGSPIFADTVAMSDDLMIGRLRDAGALIIGKTNTPEFGLGSHTYNPVHGITRNPYDKSKSCGGSSGGAAVALATGMLCVADGSDMMGSLRNPAGWNNVYGMRPTWGSVPFEPAGDLFMHQLSTSGPMARSPADLAALADTMTGSDKALPLSRTLSAAAPLLATRPKRQRIGYLGDWGGAFPFEPGIAEVSETALRQMEDMGHGVENVPPPFDVDAMWDSWITLRSFAVAAGSHLLYENPEHRALLKPAAIWEIERGMKLSAMDVHRASLIRSDWYRRATELFDTYDMLVLPSAQSWPFDAEIDYPKEIAGVQMDTYHRWMQVVVPASLIGIPVVNIPAGFGRNGLPAGLQMMGPRTSDARLLQFANEWHSTTNWPGKRPPSLVKGPN